ncbi:GAF domain-containing protein [Nonomuraea longispora]|uniref:GAF domain-containing protein n=1 Tax=Nonomuraea longispora TaxID=1848320 RepID=A0A4R4NF25_9ACTN|nr:GAF domain-containing protein [Nonomuraea longispora]
MGHGRLAAGGGSLGSGPSRRRASALRGGRARRGRPLRRPLRCAFRRTGGHDAKGTSETPRNARRLAGVVVFRHLGAGGIPRSHGDHRQPEVARPPVCHSESDQGATSSDVLGRIVDTTRVSSTAFEGTPHAPAHARKFVRQVLGEWRLSHLAEDAVLLTSELVTNAVVHAGTGIELTCRLDVDDGPAKLEIEVDDHLPARTIDECGVMPAVTPGSEVRPSGRGLALAGMLADAWGVTYTRTAKRVWVRLELADGGDGQEAVAGPPATASVDTLHVGVVVSDDDGLVRSWNSEAQQLLGWPPEQAIGRPLADLVAWRGHGPYALSLTDTLGLGRWRGEARMRHADGRLVPVYVSHLRTKGRAREHRSIWMVVAGDHRYVLTPPPAPRREAGRRIKDLLDQDMPLPELLDTIARIVQMSSGGDAAYVLLPAEGGNRFGVAAGAGATAGLVGMLATGVFGAERKTPTVIEDLLAGDVELAEQLRARSLACAPLLLAGEVTGYLAVTAEQPGRFDQELTVSLQHIADQVAVQVQRERLAEQDRAHRGRLSFLAEAGELLAGVHDEELIAALTAQLVVPKIATWAAVYLTDLAGMTRLAHVWHSEEHHNADLRKSLPAVSRAALDEVSWPSGPEAVLSFPLLTQGRSHGALVIGRTEPTLPLEVADLLADLCRLVALNLHTAMLYARQATTSRVLQRSLLPMRVAPMPGLESAVVYEPAEEGADVGGDFYDLFTVGDHWCFALGDVCGSGPEAAAVTGLARHAVRLLAKEHYTVADIFDRLNQALLEDDDDEGRFLSLLCGELTPLPQGGALCTIASAGHPPPLLLRADGLVEAVATPQLLLGIEAGARFYVETFELAPDDVLLCVTDGVTERRDGTRLLDDGNGLAALLAQCRGLSAHAVAERVRHTVETFAPEPSQDDVALLVIKAAAALRPVR